MLTNEQKLDIMKQAFEEGYDGFMSDLWAQADPQEARNIQTDTSYPPLSSTSPTVPNIKNESSPAPISNMSAEEIPNSQSLVQSYESANIGEMPMGANVPMQLDEPNSYKKGGYKVSNLIGFKPDLTDISPRNYLKNYKRYESGGVQNFIHKDDYKLEDNKIDHLEKVKQATSQQQQRTYDPLGFAGYYYQSPKHRERLEKRGYSDEEIEQRSEFVSGYGLSKGPKIVDRTGTSGSRAYPKKNKIVMDLETDRARAPKVTYDEILAHELGHLSTGYTPLKKKDVKEIVDRSQVPIKDEQNDYFASEIKSDLDSIRFMLFNAGIYDAGKEDFDWYDLNQAKEKLKESPTFRRVIDTFEDNDFMWLMNNIAMEDLEIQDGLALKMPKTRARFGGKRKKYFEGGISGETSAPVEQMSDDQLKAIIIGEDFHDSFSVEGQNAQRQLDARYGEGNWEIVNAANFNLNQTIHPQGGPEGFIGPIANRGDYNHYWDSEAHPGTGPTNQPAIDFFSSLGDIWPENMGPNTDIILWGHTWEPGTGASDEAAFMGHPYIETKEGVDPSIMDPDSWAEFMGSQLEEDWAGCMYFGTCGGGAIGKGSGVPVKGSTWEDDISLTGLTTPMQDFTTQLSELRPGDLYGSTYYAPTETWYGTKLSNYYPFKTFGFDPTTRADDDAFAGTMFDPLEKTMSSVYDDAYEVGSPYQKITLQEPGFGYDGSEVSPLDIQYSQTGTTELGYDYPVKKRYSPTSGYGESFPFYGSYGYTDFHRSVSEAYNSFHHNKPYYFERTGGPRKKYPHGGFHNPLSARTLIGPNLTKPIVNAISNIFFPGADKFHNWTKEKGLTTPTTRGGTFRPGVGGTYESHPLRQQINLPDYPVDGSKSEIDQWYDTAGHEWFHHLQAQTGRLAQKEIRQNPVALKGKDIVGPISKETQDLHFGARGTDFDHEVEEIENDLMESLSIPEASLLSENQRIALLNNKTPRWAHRLAGLPSFPSRSGQHTNIRNEANQRLYEHSHTTEGEARDVEEDIGGNQVFRSYFDKYHKPNVIADFENQAPLSAANAYVGNISDTDRIRNEVWGQFVKPGNLYNPNITRKYYNDGGPRDFKNIKEASKVYADNWGIKNKQALNILKDMNYNVGDTVMFSSLRGPGGDSMLRTQNELNTYDYMTELYPEIIGPDGVYDMDLMNQKMKEHGYKDEYGNIKNYKRWSVGDLKLHLSKLSKTGNFRNGGLRRKK